VRKCSNGKKGVIRRQPTQPNKMNQNSNRGNTNHNNKSNNNKRNKIIKNKMKKTETYDLDDAVTGTRQKPVRKERGQRQIATATTQRKEAVGQIGNFRRQSMKERERERKRKERNV